MLPALFTSNVTCYLQSAFFHKHANAFSESTFKQIGNLVPVHWSQLVISAAATDMSARIVAYFIYRKVFFNLLIINIDHLLVFKLK